MSWSLPCSSGRSGSSGLLLPGAGGGGAGTFVLGLLAEMESVVKVLIRRMPRPTQSTSCGTQREKNNESDTVKTQRITGLMDRERAQSDCLTWAIMPFFWIFLKMRAGHMKQMRLPMVAPVRPRIVSTGEEENRRMNELTCWAVSLKCRCVNPVITHKNKNKKLKHKNQYLANHLTKEMDRELKSFPDTSHF